MGWSWRLVPPWLCCSLTQYPTLQHLARAVSRAFPDLGSLLTPEPCCCWKPLCLVRRTPQPDPDPCPAAAGGEHFSTEPQKQKQALLPWLRMWKPHTAALRLLLGVDFTREIIVVCAGALLETRSDLDLASTCTVAVWAMDLWARSSSCSFSFPPNHELWFYVILLF